MLQMMRESATIEEAMVKIVRKPEFVANLFRLNMADGERWNEFAHRLIRNYSIATGAYGRPFRMQNIETILSLELKSDSRFVMDHLMMLLYPQLLTNPDLRNDYLTHSLLNDLDWLAPLLVLTDYFTYYLDADADKGEDFMGFMLGVAASME
jgi:hypothetical protein